MNTGFLINGTIKFWPDAHCLVVMRDNEKVSIPLNVPASRCLSLLIANHGNVVEQEVFFQNVWRQHGIEVSTNTLHQNILILRKAFATAGEKDKIVVTIPRKGLTITTETSIILIQKSTEVTLADELHKDSTLEQVILTQSFSRKNSRKRENYFAYSIIILGFLVFVFLINSQMKNTQTNYLENYQLELDSDNYRVYISPRNKIFSNTPNELTEIIKNSKTFSRNNVIYFTSHDTSDRESTISCDNDFKDNNNPNCISIISWKKK